MSRTVPEWIGDNPDQTIPPRVRLRVFTRQFGLCPICHRNLRPGHWDLDHRVALINGGEHREANLQAVCTSPCHSDKSKEDAAQKSTNYQRQLSHAGIKKRKQLIPGSKGTGLRKRMDGTVERRK